jgi:hypothetical protein
MAKPIAGTVSWGTSDPRASSTTLSTPDYNQLMNDLEGWVCGYPCASGSGDDDVSLSLWASSYTGPGDVVAFQFDAVPMEDVTAIEWDWQSSNPDDSETTTSGYCSSVPDTSVCSMPVFSDGLMTVGVMFTEGRERWESTYIAAEIEPCPGSQPDKDKLRKQYASRPKVPDCLDLKAAPEGSGGWPSWSEIQSHGSTATQSNYAIYATVLDNGLQAVLGHLPLTFSRIYSTPAHQIEVNSNAPNGMHIWGHAADILTTTSVWQMRADTVAQLSVAAGLTPCLEPKTASGGGHVHVDYRQMSGVIWQWTHCPNVW